MNEDTIRIMSGLLIVIGIIFIFSSLSIAFYEFYGAKSFCSDQKGDYSFNFKQIKHFCNDEEINRYSDGWEFVKFKPNLNDLRVELP